MVARWWGSPFVILGDGLRVGGAGRGGAFVRWAGLGVGHPGAVGEFFGDGPVAQADGAGGAHESLFVSFLALVEVLRLLQAVAKLHVHLAPANRVGLAWIYQSLLQLSRLIVRENLVGNKAKPTAFFAFLLLHDNRVDKVPKLAEELGDIAF